MRDFENTKGGNMVIDEIGLKLVEELSEGPWTEDKEMSLKEEISFNRDFREKFRHVQLRLIPSVDLADALDGFVSSLNSSKVGELKDPILKGSSFIDALVNLFQKDYLHSEEISEDINKGKDINESSIFSELIDNQSARDEYIWENRKEVFRKIIEEKLNEYFSAISNYIQLDGVLAQLLSKLKVHFTGKDGRKGREFIMGYTSDGNETFENWSLRMSEEYIKEQFEGVLKVVLSVKPLYKVINGNNPDIDFTYFYKDRMSKLFQLLRLDNYLRNELELKKDDIDSIYRHYCRHLLNDNFSGLREIIGERKDTLPDDALTAAIVVIPIVQHFVDTYVSKAKTCKDREKLFCLLGNQQELDKFLWTEREEEFKIRIKENLRKIYEPLYLKMSEEDCETVIKESKSFFTGNEGLRTLQRYSFGDKEKFETWLKKELEKKIDERCKKYLDQNLVSKLRDYYLSKEKNPRDRFQRMKQLAQDYILSDELDEETRRSWRMLPEEDTSLVYDHYIYTLVNGSRKSFMNVLKEFKDGAVGLKDCFKNDFYSYLNDGKCYVDKEKEYKIMLDENNRKIFLGFLEMNNNALRRHLYGKKSNYDRKIKSQIRDVYSHLIFTGKTDDKKQLKARKQKKDEAVKQLHDDLRLFLTDDAGWAFVRNYSFKEKFEKWRDDIIDNYIEAKPRIDLLTKERDGHILRSYLENKDEFLTYLVNIYNDFTRLGSSSVPLKERGVPSKDKRSSFRRPKVSVDEILLNGFNGFLMDDVENFITNFYGLKKDGPFVKPNAEWGCEKQFENFRFESKLSTYMYDVWYNFYMGLIRQEFPSLSKNSRKDEIINVLISVFEQNPLKESIGKNNKERILNDYLELAKKEFNEKKKNLDQFPDLPKDEEILRILIKHLREPRVSSKNENKNLEIIIDSALVTYAWRFFDYSRHDFNNVEQMKKSFEELGNSWKFFDDRVVNFQIDDIKRIEKTMSVEEIKVLPKLLAYCHIQYCWYIKNEKDYDKLMKFYGMNYNLMRRWKSDSDTEFVKKVSSFFEQFEGPEYSELRSNLPKKLFNIYNYFIENKIRDGLKITNKGLRLGDPADELTPPPEVLEDMTDAEVLADLFKKYPSKYLEDYLEDRLWKRKNRMKNEKGRLSSEKRRAKILTMKKND